MDLPRIASKCLADGLTGLSVDEQRELRAHFRNETRKGAFRPAGDPADVLAAFCRGLAATDAGEIAQVVDYQQYLRRNALALAGNADTMPLAALVLYATWIEHWLNMMLTVLMLRRGDNVNALERYFVARPDLEEKVSALEGSFSIPSLPKQARDTLIQVVKTRNRYVHYTWVGQPPRLIAQDHAGIRALIKRAEPLLDSLLQYEHLVLDAPFDSLTTEIFQRAG